MKINRKQFLGIGLMSPGIIILGLWIINYYMENPHGLIYATVVGLTVAGFYIFVSNR